MTATFRVMRIACPNCAAAYEVPDTALASGPRLLKCARCGHQFQAALPEAPKPEAAEPPPPPEAAAPAPPPPEPPPPEPPPPEPLPPEPAPEPAPPPAEEAERPPPTRGPARHSPIEPLPAPPARDTRLVMAWILSLAVLGGAGWAAVHYRAEVMQAFPPAARLYLALGLG